MPWQERVHRCARPDIPANYGPGSVWQCGDVGTDTCGKYWQVVAATDGTLTWLEDDSYTPPATTTTASGSSGSTTTTGTSSGTSTTTTTP